MLSGRRVALIAYEERIVYAIRLKGSVVCAIRLKDRLIAYEDRIVYAIRSKGSVVCAIR